MHPWILPVLSFIGLVVVPGLAQELLIPVLDRHRIDGPIRRPARRGRFVWRRTDADPANYTPPGKRLLAGFKFLTAVQILGGVLWASLFLL